MISRRARFSTPTAAVTTRPPSSAGRCASTESGSPSGVCYDNAMAESFFAALKNERVNRTQYPTRKHAMNDIARYIELRYNSQRLHSGLGYKTPNEVYNEYLNGQRAA